MEVDDNYWPRTTSVVVTTPGKRVTKFLRIKLGADEWFCSEIMGPQSTWESESVLYVNPREVESQIGQVLYGQLSKHMTDHKLIQNDAFPG